MFGRHYLQRLNPCFSGNRFGRLFFNKLGQCRVTAVLILVLVEIGLGEQELLLFSMATIVLILVLVEIGLGACPARRP